MKLLENNFGKLRCPYCDSVFVLEKGDLHACSQDPGEYYFECPICGERKYFEPDILGQDTPYVKIHKYGSTPHR